MGRYTDKFIPPRDAFLKRYSDQPTADPVASTLEDVVRHFEATVLRVERDRNLSDVGVKNAIQAARVEAGQQIASIRETVILDQLGPSIEGLEASLTPTPVPADPLTALLDHMRHAEIRRGLESVDVVTLRGEFNLLDPDVQAALRSGPPRVVTSDTGAVKFETLAPPTPPPTSPELDSLRDFRDGVNGLLNQAETDLATRNAMILAQEAEGGTS